MKSPSIWLKNSLQLLHSLHQEERRIGVRILEILQEIENKKAYSELGYDGLFSFCVQELKYTESQAFQRVQAMRAMKSIPLLKEKIKMGTLSMTAVSQVQVFIRQEQNENKRPMSLEQKIEIFNQVENKTTKEVKQILANLRGETVKTKLFLELDEEIEKQWQEFKAKTAHQHQGSDLNAFKILLNYWLKSHNLKNNKSNTQPVKTNEFKLNSNKNINSDIITDINAETNTDKTGVTSEMCSLNEKSKLGLTQVKTRYIPVKIKQAVFTRDQEKCTLCSSKYALEIDHILPFAKNGTHELNNLRLLCRSCNQAQGVKHFGESKMKRNAEIRI